MLRDNGEPDSGHECSIYLPRLARITSAQQVTSTEKLFSVELEDRQPLGHAPGQFIEVSIPGVGEAPISLCTSPTEGPDFGICVRKAGVLTTRLHSMHRGEWIGVRGPFGHGFPMAEAEGKDLLFVAGGIGMAPLRSAVRYAVDNRDHYRNVTVLHGAKTVGELLFQEDLSSWTNGSRVKVLTTVDFAEKGWNGEEGGVATMFRPDERGVARKYCWTGRVGVITTLFPDVQLESEQTVALVVGPPIMYRFVILELLGRGIPEKQIILSLERRMKCGVGKCGHCQINGVCVCQEGPAFSYARLGNLWEAVERAAPIV